MESYKFDDSDIKQWRKEKIAKMKIHVDNLVEVLSRHGIIFIEKDGDLENVIFRKEDRQLKIAWVCFYKFSGPCFIGNIPMTDEIYINTFQGSVIKKFFKII